MTFVGVKEAAIILKYSNVQSVYNLVHSGEITFYKMGGRRQLLFDRCELEKRSQPKKIEALENRAEAILFKNESRHHPDS